MNFVAVRSQRVFTRLTLNVRTNILCFSFLGHGRVEIAHTNHYVFQQICNGRVCKLNSLYALHSKTGLRMIVPHVSAFNLFAFTRALLRREPYGLHPLMHQHPLGAAPTVNAQPDPCRDFLPRAPTTSRTMNRIVPSIRRGLACI